MSTTPRNVIIVGGHGKVALLLSKILSAASHNVFSLIRSEAHNSDIEATGAHPLLLSLEAASVSELTKVFEDKDADAIYFSAGAGGKGGPERTKKVDYEGAIKVFDAIEAMQTAKKPRLILVSAIDVRNPDKTPAHYDETDIERSKKAWGAIGSYMRYKYEADSNLIKRSSFKWTILRPGTLKDEPGVGKADIGKTHISQPISREDVARTLALLLDREDAIGIAIDLVGGETPIEDGLDNAIHTRETYPLEYLS